MLTARQIAGKWWVPDHPDNPVAGELDFAADRFDLNVHGALTMGTPTEPESFNDLLWELADVPVIHGEAHDGDDLVTLLGSHGLAAPVALGGSAETWHVEAALVGAHLDSDPVFDRVVFQVEHLDEWANVPKVGRDIQRDTQGHTTTCVAEAVRRGLGSADVAGLGTFEIEAIPIYEISGRRGTIALNGRVHLTPLAPVSWKDALMAASHFRDLVRLAIGKRCGITLLELRSVVVDEFERPQWTKVLVRTTAMLRDTDDSVRWPEMLCRLDALPGGIAAALPLWWRLRGRYERPWSLLFGQDDSRLLHVSEAFVARERALEAFHATDHGGSSAAKAERDDRVVRALAALPPDLVEWAQPLLEESTPPVARHRVKEIIESLGPVGAALAGGDIDRFVRRVVATRNDLIHPPAGEAKAIVLDGEDRYWHGEALYWIGVLYLLRQLGMSLDDLSVGQTRNRTYRNVVERMARQPSQSGSA